MAMPDNHPNFDAASRALIPKSPTRAPIIIEGVATAESPMPGKEQAQASAAETVAPGRRGFAYWPAMTAVAVALGLGAGFAGGVAAWRHAGDTKSLIAANGELQKKVRALETARSGVDAGGARGQIAALKSDLDKARLSIANQSSQLSGRVDKVERDAAARLDKIEKALMSRDATASIHALPTAPPLPPIIGGKDKPAPVAKLSERPRVPNGGWVLREVRDGAALVENDKGVREVLPGDSLPGLGRVRSVERRSGQWVVVTSAGVIDQEAY